MNRQVTKDEFDAFIAEHPGLRYDMYRIGEPPMGTYNDFSGGKVWPQSIVALVELTELYLKTDPKPYQWKPNTYFLRETK